MMLIPAISLWKGEGEISQKCIGFGVVHFLLAKDFIDLAS
jgi:hypothetical protein